jgi:hypothetical protein
MGRNVPEPAARLDAGVVQGAPDVPQEMVRELSGMTTLTREQGQLQEMREVPRAPGRFLRTAQCLQGDELSGDGKGFAPLVRRAMPA